MRYANKPTFQTEYEIMHSEKVVATVSLNGRAHILNEQFMPYDLYLEEETDLDTLVNNVTNFYFVTKGSLMLIFKTF